MGALLGQQFGTIIAYTTVCCFLTWVFLKGSKNTKGVLIANLLSFLVVFFLLTVENFRTQNFNIDMLYNTAYVAISQTIAYLILRKKNKTAQ